MLLKICERGYLIVVLNICSKCVFSFLCGLARINEKSLGILFFVFVTHEV